MSDLLAARSQMAMSLAFHIIFAVVGIGMPVLMVIAERRWQKTGDAICLDLAKRWAKGTAILFAVGAVSGTVLSFELGLLWPTFMEQAGPIIGMPFSLEGFAFFTEAIFLGIYLYGWDRISRRAHLWAGVAVAVSGAASGIFVVIANAWMNAPTGFDLAADGRIVNVDPIAGMLNPMAFQQALHMTLASYVATGFAVAGIHALLLLRDPKNAFHRRALGIALLVGAPAAVLQPLSGDLSARVVAKHQPAKLAAMEALFETRRGAPLLIGGWPDPDAGTVRYAIEIPRGLSLLAFHDPDAEVQGLDEVPADERPAVNVVRMTFQTMVGIGFFLALLGAVHLYRLARRRGLPSTPWFFRAVIAAGSLAVVALIAGWVTTEVGRQPWVVYGVMRTEQAVTGADGIPVGYATLVIVYVGLIAATGWVLRRLSLAPIQQEADDGAR
jgi:cytochrome d ubiquinol oxidase subunit I